MGNSQSTKTKARSRSKADPTSQSPNTASEAEREALNFILHHVVQHPGLTHDRPDFVVTRIVHAEESDDRTHPTDPTSWDPHLVASARELAPDSHTHSEDEFRAKFLTHDDKNGQGYGRAFLAHGDTVECTLFGTAAFGPYTWRDLADRRINVDSKLDKYAEVLYVHALKQSRDTTGNTAKLSEEKRVEVQDALLATLLRALKADKSAGWTGVLVQTHRSELVDVCKRHGFNVAMEETDRDEKTWILVMSF